MANPTEMQIRDALSILDDYSMSKLVRMIPLHVETAYISRGTVYIPGRKTPAGKGQGHILARSEIDTYTDIAITSSLHSDSIRIEVLHKVPDAGLEKGTGAEVDKKHWVSTRTGGKVSIVYTGGRSALACVGMEVMSVRWDQESMTLSPFSEDELPRPVKELHAEIHRSCTSLCGSPERVFMFFGEKVLTYDPVRKDQHQVIPLGPGKFGGASRILNAVYRRAEKVAFFIRDAGLYRVEQGESGEWTASKDVHTGSYERELYRMYDRPMYINCSNAVLCETGRVCIGALVPDYGAIPSVKLQRTCESARQICATGRFTSDPAERDGSVRSVVVPHSRVTLDRNMDNFAMTCVDGGVFVSYHEPVGGDLSMNKLMAYSRVKDRIVHLPLDDTEGEVELHRRGTDIVTCTTFPVFVRPIDQYLYWMYRVSCRGDA